MERLTYNSGIEGKTCWQIHGADNRLCSEVCNAQDDTTGCEFCPISRAFEKLAAYEDTGLDPHEVDELIAKHVQEQIEERRRGK